METPIEKPPVTRGRVLLVEDDSAVAAEIETRLRNLNYSVAATAVSGTDAIEKTESNLPDIVLMDLQIKGELDGIEAAEQIRASFQVPVVYLASQTDEYTIERAKITDPLGYLFTPFEDRELEITIEMALYKHQMQQEREELIRELQEAMFEVRRLSGLLPICISCKKIRDDRGYWNRVEEYLQKHSHARFTHGYCPECARKFWEATTGKPKH